MSSTKQCLQLRPQPAFTCSKLAKETLEQGVFIVNFEHILQLVLVFLLLMLNI